MAGCIPPLGYLMPEIITRRSVLIKLLSWPISSSLLLANSHILIQHISNNLYVTTRSWFTGKDSACLTWQLHGGQLSACLLPPRILFCLLRSPKGCPIKRPRQLLYSTNKSNTNREEPSIPFPLFLFKQKKKAFTLT